MTPDRPSAMVTSLEEVDPTPSVVTIGNFEACTAATARCCTGRSTRRWIGTFGPS